MFFFHHFAKTNTKKLLKVGKSYLSYSTVVKSQHPYQYLVYIN